MCLHLMHICAKDKNDSAPFPDLIGGPQTKFHNDREISSSDGKKRLTRHRSGLYEESKLLVE